MDTVDRITPAWAGKSVAGSVRVGVAGDHPRVGGEKIYPLCFSVFTTGSPPRGRGKAEYQAAMDTVDRITPAWAGKRAPYPASGGRG